jgi:hypothetical protein
MFNVAREHSIIYSFRLSHSLLLRLDCIRFFSFDATPDFEALVLDFSKGSERRNNGV